jgi:hypothetical protein
MLAKHKVGSSTLLTRSIFKPLGNQGLFLFVWSGPGADITSKLFVDFRLPGQMLHPAHYRFSFIVSQRGPSDLPASDEDSRACKKIIQIACRQVLDQPAESFRAVCTAVP